jgi:hypothetical protein
MAQRKTEPPPTKVEGFSGLERLRRTVGPFPTEVGGFKTDFWKMKTFAVFIGLNIWPHSIRKSDFTIHNIKKIVNCFPHSNMSGLTIIIV